MKIALYVQHYGLRDMMLDLLEDHEIKIYQFSAYGDKKQFSTGEEDLIISTWPHLDLSYQKGNKPVIIYTTNPIYDIPTYLKICKEKWITVIKDGENCYPYQYYPVEAEFSIPHSINPEKYPKWTGEIPITVIINRKPFFRWNIISKSFYGDYYEWNQLMPDIPFVYLYIPDRKLFLERLSKYRVVFYYSDTPYTIFLYELMAMKMPIVAFDNHIWAKEALESPIHKYLKNYSTKQIEIRQMLHKILKEPPQPVDYPIPLFSEIKQKWNEVIQYAMKKYVR